MEHNYQIYAGNECCKKCVICGLYKCDTKLNMNKWWLPNESVVTKEPSCSEIVMHQVLE